jgi:hypothetical protein
MSSERQPLQETLVKLSNSDHTSFKNYIQKLIPEFVGFGYIKANQENLAVASLLLSMKAFEGKLTPDERSTFNSQIAQYYASTQKQGSEQSNTEVKEKAKKKSFFSFWRGGVDKKKTKHRKHKRKAATFKKIIVT